MARRSGNVSRLSIDLGSRLGAAVAGGAPPAQMRPSHRPSQGSSRPHRISIAELSRTRVFECDLCCEESSAAEKVTIEGCLHDFCSTCLRRQAQLCLEQRQPAILCPMCQADSELREPRVIPDDTMKRCLSSGDYEQCIRIREQVFLEKHDFKICPRPSCQGRVIGSASNSKCECPVGTCRFAWCCNCGGEWHEGETCMEYQARHYDAEFDAWRRLNYCLPCPSCGVYVSKPSGCNHMKCLCGTHFCYICGSKTGVSAAAEEGAYAHWPTKCSRNAGLFDDPAKFGMPDGGGAAGAPAAAPRAPTGFLRPVAGTQSPTRPSLRGLTREDADAAAIAQGEKITVFAKMLTGKTITMIAAPSDRVLVLKQQILAKEAIDVDAQRLIYGGKQLQDDGTLMDYNIHSEATLHLVLRLKGGILLLENTDLQYAADRTA